MNNLEYFFKTQHFDMKKKNIVYNEYITLCDTLEIPKTKRAKKRELYMFFEQKGYNSVRRNTGAYFIK